MDSTKIAPDKLAAYEATHYRIGMDATAPVLRIGVRSEELARMHAQAGVACSLFIPAWNPFGAQRPEAENQAAHEELRAELAARAPRIVEGSGGEPIMRTIFGLEKPDAGTLTVKGEAVTRFSAADAVARGIG